MQESEQLQKLFPLKKMLENLPGVPSPLKLIEFGFKDISTLEGHFVPSPREREKKDRRDSR